MIRSSSQPPPVPNGIHLMLFAFFDSDGGLDRDAMRRQVEAAAAAGAAGIAVLGLATEVAKLSDAERRSLIDWAAADRDAIAASTGRRLPLAVTVAGASVDAQAAFGREALRRGADWLILQPPPERDRPESFYEKFFADVLDRVDAVVGIQNAPEYLGVGLGPDALLRLRDRCPSFRVLKGEAPAVAIERTVAAVGPALPVFNGRGGLELVDNLRAGCAGMIVAADTFDLQIAIERAWRAGDEAGAERLYRALLPTIVFSMQSLDTLVVYGKRIAAHRLGVAEVHDRAVSARPTDFGLRIAARLADELGALKRIPA